jgi:hypothetical protein
MIPFHSMAAFNPGHLVWDDFLPLYSLLHIFGFDNKVNAVDLLLLRYVLPLGGRFKSGVWAGCDWEGKSEVCAKMMRKFAGLMIRRNESQYITTQNEPEYGFRDANSNKKQLICARNGLAGLGPLSDHGTKKGHGWEAKDYKTTYNQGRGGQFWKFRNFMMENLGIFEDNLEEEDEDAPLRILFSEHSSKSRDISMNKQMQALMAAIQDKSRVPSDLPEIIVEAHQLSKYTIKEQAQMVSKTAAYISTNGGGAVTASFLPRGASLLLYYQHKGGFELGKRTGKPARLDWDYLNNASYLRVHWVPDEKRESRAALDALVDLILHDVTMFYHERKERIRQQKQEQEQYQ